jgi:nucleoside-diphosphate-sugar epimerase
VATRPGRSGTTVARNDILYWVRWSCWLGVGELSWIQAEQSGIKNVRVVITGTDGYIGSLLAPMLLERGYDVVGVDTGFYRTGWLFNASKWAPRTLNRDIRLLREDDLDDAQAIVHMAELSNDPTGELAPDITDEINHKGSVRLAELAKQRGVERFVYTSSCSVYGLAVGEMVDETSPVSPQTNYAKSKVLVERAVSALADDRFSPVFLRNATAYGASPRMRFDLVLNNLAGFAWTTKEIKVLSDGTPWRPLVHVRDICKAIICALEAPRETVHNRFFNVGDSTGNYQIREIAEIVGRVFRNCRVAFGPPSADNRSYRVSFEKINRELGGFFCDWGVEKGAQELLNLFDRIGMSEEIFHAPPFTRLKMLKYLIQTKQIDDNFFWTYGNES